MKLNLRRRIEWPKTLTVLRARSSTDFVCLCWQCADKTGHMEVNTTDRLYFCHKHHKGGTFPESAMPRLIGLQDLRELKPFIEREESTPEDFFFARDDARIVKYLKEKRGLTDDLIDDLKPHVKAGDPWRVYFPIFDDRGAIRSFVGRAMKPAKYRYWTHRVAGETYPLWGVHRLASREIVLVEGILDAVWFRNRLACLAHRLTGAHRDILRKLRPVSVTVAYDNDTDAVEAAYSDAKSLQLLSVPIYVARLPINKDPDALRRDNSFMKNRERIL